MVLELQQAIQLVLTTISRCIEQIRQTNQPLAIAIEQSINCFEYEKLLLLISLDNS